MYVCTYVLRSLPTYLLFSDIFPLEVNAYEIICISKYENLINREPPVLESSILFTWYLPDFALT